MNLLLQERYAPITSEIGFLQTDCKSAAGAFRAWQEPIQAKRSVRLSQRIVAGSLSEALESLLPLTTVERRRTLFVPTQSNWTAYFDNGARGGDPASVVSYLCQIIGCRGVRVVCIPHTLNSEAGRAPGRYGAVIWELFGPERGEFLNTIRSVFVAYDGGKWKFQAFGTPQPFENPEKYKARKTVDRFTPDMLAEHLKALGIDAFSEAFYSPQEGAWLVSKEGPHAPNMTELTLEETAPRSEMRNHQD